MTVRWWFTIIYAVFENDMKIESTQHKDKSLPKAIRKKRN